MTYIPFRTNSVGRGVWSGWYLIQGHYVHWKAPDECYDVVRCNGPFCVYC